MSCVTWLLKLVVWPFFAARNLSREERASEQDVTDVALLLAMVCLGHGIGFLLTTTQHTPHSKGNLFVGVVLLFCYLCVGWVTYHLKKTSCEKGLQSIW